MTGMSAQSAAAPVGELLRTWRRRRSLSQLDLALDAAVSSRHVSFLETGRAQPSREMVLRLAEHLDVPLRERNGCCSRPVTHRCSPNGRSTPRR